MRPPRLTRPASSRWSLLAAAKLPGRGRRAGSLTGVKTLAALDASIAKGEALFAVAVLWAIETKEVLSVGAASIKGKQIGWLPLTDGCQTALRVAGAPGEPG